MNQRLLFLIYCLIALVVTYIPLIGIGFKWLETIFHELSHALMTVLTGGTVIKFKLELSGAGMVLSRGGNGVIIAFFGYFGAAIWGFLLYQAGYRVRIIKATLAALIVAFLLVLILWVRDILTIAILLVMVGVFMMALKNIQGRILNSICQISGVIVLFNAIKSPLYLLNVSNAGDSALLANLTLIPEFIWVFIWFGIGVYLLYKMWLLSEDKRNNENSTI
jgi:hypothetical protein